MIFENKKYILLDLDGTVTDSSLGIVNSVEYALKFYGITGQDRKKLECFIGPPLSESFEMFYGFSKEQAVEAVEKYREYYKDKGIFENRVYDCVVPFLKRMKAQGKMIILATSKPEVFAKRILDHFDLTQYFDHCCGSLLNGERVKKADVIRYAMELAGITDVKEAVMIGDRHHDIEGAHAVGMEAVGVLYGFGDREEMEACNADYILELLS